MSTLKVNVMIIFIQVRHHHDHHHDTPTPRLVDMSHSLSVTVSCLILGHTHSDDQFLTDNHTDADYNTDSQCKFELIIIISNISKCNSLTALTFIFIL